MTNKDYRDILLDYDQWYQRQDFASAQFSMRGAQKEAFRKIRAAFPDAAGMTLPVLADAEHGVYLVILSDGKGSRSTRSIVAVNGHDPKILYTAAYDENSELADNLIHHPGLVMFGDERFLTYETPRTAVQREDAPELWDKMAIPLDNVVPFYPALEEQHIPLEERVAQYVGVRT